MEAQQDDNDVNALETPETTTSTGASGDDSKPDSEKTPNVGKKRTLGDRAQGLISRVNIYLLLFILIVVLAAGVVFVSMQRSKKETAKAPVDQRELTPEELENISGSDARVGDPKQTLTIESNAILSGQVLVRSNLDVAGTINVGTRLTVPGITVSGDTVLDQVAANGLTIANDASIQGQFNVQGNFSVTGASNFGGPISAPQATLNSLQMNGDLQLNRHIDAGGPTPGRTNGSALGNGGTSSISGTDTAGTVTINTGGSPPAGCFVTVNFRQAFRGTPHVVITPVGSAGGIVDYYVTRNTGSFSICTSTAPPAGASFAFDYIAID